MPEFSNFTDLAKHLQRVARDVPKVTEKAMHAIGKTVGHAARAKIGEYQGAAGEFNAWAQLEDATQADRLRKGFSANDPLLRSGELAASVSYDLVIAGRAQTLSVGSDLDLGLWQEMGTRTIPPRPFVGPAMFEHEKHSQEILAKAIEELFAKV
jgi:hypothetical protein